MNQAQAISAVAQGFTAAIRALNPPPPPPTQAEKVAALKQLYLDGKITVISLDLELGHLPGGMGE